MRLSGARATCVVRAFVVFLLVSQAPSALADTAESYFNRVKDNPVLLREFLFRFPKGGELHTHLDGAVYPESYIRWSASDGKCIDLSRTTITLPPCDRSTGIPPVADIQYDPAIVNPVIDAFSVRNYERRSVSGHDQFFGTFDRFSLASRGRQGSMLAEVTARTARQNNFYLELMESTGMRKARELAQRTELFDGSSTPEDILATDAFKAIIADTIKLTDEADAQWHGDLGCDADPQALGCNVQIRYIAQVIRIFPREQVFAQTLLAFALIDEDQRYVGLNFVAPEDAPIALRDYSEHMKIIRDIAKLFPDAADKVSLHAGELAMPLVPPEYLHSHIHEAVHIAGAKRIGHGVDIIYEDHSADLLRYMAENRILVEINLTSNAVILGVEGDDHPFELYRSMGVPLALSTDDEGVARIDLTHEYQRAVTTYNLDYTYLKELSRNAIAYSFLDGVGLFVDIPQGLKVKTCRRDRPGKALSDDCRKFLASSEKARMQWGLEERFHSFEEEFKDGDNNGFNSYQR